MDLTQTSKILSVLFTTYGENDSKRLAIYCQVLKDIPAKVLEKAVMKVIIEWDRVTLPPPAVITNAARSISEEAHPDTRMKLQAEALGEIEAKMLSTPFGKRPMWSTKEIARTVECYGWENLIHTLEEDMPTVRAQLRRVYEDCCKRRTEEAHNQFCLGVAPSGILGIETKRQGGMMQLAEILPRNE